MLQDYLNHTQSLGTKEVAKIIKVSVGTVQKLVDTGRLTAWKTIGGHRRIPASALIKYMSTNNLVAEASFKMDTSLRVILLCNLVENEKIEIMSVGKGLSVSFIFFDNPIQMQLNLLEIRPSLIFIEEEIFNNIGSNSWISTIKKNTLLTQTKIINMNEIPFNLQTEFMSEHKSMSLAQKIVCSNWFSGFVTGYSYD